jgi:hypothetical protein
MDGTFTGAVDRVVDDTTAVILVEDGSEAVGQVTVPVSELPAALRGEGSRLLLRVSDDELVSVEPEPEPEQADEGESIREKFDRLSRRLSEE